MDFIRKIETRYRPDVLIVGGGPAGCAAALYAARNGSRVLLCEASGALGGLGTLGLVPAFMTFGDYGAVFLASGVGREILDGMHARSSRAMPEYSIPVEALKRTYDDLLTEAGVEVIFFSQLIGVEMAGANRVSAAVFASKSGLWAVTAKAYIDATGDGDLCAWAGAEVEKGDDRGNLMATTLCSLWSGIDWLRAGRGGDDRNIEKAIADGVVPNNDRHLPGIWNLGAGIGGGNIGHQYDVDPLDERSMTRAMFEGRKILDGYEAYYKKYLEGYEDMTLVSTANLLGVRESRRIMGDYVLCLDDFQSRRHFDDEIGCYCYPVDIHASNPSKDAHARFTNEHTNLRYKSGESYGIPYRTLTPRGLDNVWTAGRCLSTDRAMQSSVRVMPGCYITGQAAGLAASIAARSGGGSRDVEAAGLRDELRRMGAYLP